MVEEAKTKFWKKWLDFLSNEEFKMLVTLIVIFTPMHIAGLIDSSAYEEFIRIAIIFAFGDNAVSTYAKSMKGDL